MSCGYRRPEAGPICDEQFADMSRNCGGGFGEDPKMTALSTGQSAGSQTAFDWEEEEDNVTEQRRKNQAGRGLGEPREVDELSSPVKEIGGRKSAEVTVSGSILRVRGVQILGTHIESQLDEEAARKRLRAEDPRDAVGIGGEGAHEPRCKIKCSKKETAPRCPYPPHGACDFVFGALNQALATSWIFRSHPRKSRRAEPPSRETESRIKNRMKKVRRRAGNRARLSAGRTGH
ncbi:hypothetical protein DFH09DRAFT_1289817 [Mycena vulgaris]|nr:hypothetical protein DFH09DRAFT_1289817 [Mycena vulgaris]